VTVLHLTSPRDTPIKPRSSKRGRGHSEGQSDTEDAADRTPGPSLKRSLSKGPTKRRKLLVTAIGEKYEGPPCPGDLPPGSSLKRLSKGQSGGPTKRPTLLVADSGEKLLVADSGEKCFKNKDGQRFKGPIYTELNQVNKAMGRGKAKKMRKVDGKWSLGNAMTVYKFLSLNNDLTPITVTTPIGCSVCCKNKNFMTTSEGVCSHARRRAKGTKCCFYKLSLMHDQEEDDIV
jgi:hypothetical protein